MLKSIIVKLLLKSLYVISVIPLNKIRFWRALVLNVLLCNVKSINVKLLLKSIYVINVIPLNVLSLKSIYVK